MKKISTQVKNFILLVLILIITFNSQAQSSPPVESNVFNFSFISIPTLIAGTGTGYNLGTKYLFTNVANNVNAIVTIVSATGGATVSMLDDNALTMPEAFSPAITIPANSNGLVEFKIEYVKANGNPRQIDTLSVTAMDIDGNSTVHEVDALNLGTGGTVSYLSNTLQIVVTQSGSQFTGTNVGGIEYNGVDTSAKQVMFSVKNSSLTNFIYKAGANNAGNIPVTRQKGIYFKGFNYVAAAPLPVKYLSFTGNAINNCVILKWTTSQETNNHHFEIERSFNGKEFSLAGLALDGFENGTNKEYAFKDNSILLENKEIVYYRLKQFDNDGKFTYSTILIIRIKAANKVDIQVSPNPFTEKLIVRFTGSANTIADIRIVNLAGQAIMIKKAAISKGYNNIQIEGLQNLSAGTYVATIIVDGKIVGNQKIVK